MLHLRYCPDDYDTSEGREAISVVGVVVIGVAVGVDIAEIIAVARIRRTLPPVVGRLNDNAESNQFLPVMTVDLYL